MDHDIPLYQQQLLFKDKLLENHRTLSYYDIHMQSRVLLFLRGTGSMKIFVKLPIVKTVTLKVDPNDTIKDIKMKINDKEHIKVEYQQLVFDNIQLEDSKTLLDYNIQQKSTLELFIPDEMQVYIKTQNGKIITLAVHPNDFIEDVKIKIELPGLKKQLFFC
ncbi:unnamed protein product [Rotaria sordida]|uniref:Ubiquitin-like domain-containing protein n=2 Tax=Rotaria sordida TaxID=392033 RepID=A0A819XMC9_9BILA|nr:unnamed protein product [Rotaria sordida]